ncbi:MAG: hypothetical protein IJG80_05120 [Selenomonadaceae bacterium]|nr:hypothetical protein [Selenomonadaceae bacterium]MBQ3726892.1 hypothetical protein [Selenomonadaceae bacterium]MBQ9497947.1 hypothetical protein [Selenomonadaceae bacterium]
MLKIGNQNAAGKIFSGTRNFLSGSAQNFGGKNFQGREKFFVGLSVIQ